MTNDSPTRRRMLGLTGSVVVAGIAGCTGTLTDDGQEESGHDEGEEEGSHSDGEGGDSHSGEEEEGSHNEEEEEGSHNEEEEEGGHNDDGHGHDEAVGEPTDTADVAMVTTDDGKHFEPHVVRVNVGGTVAFHNESGSHSTTAYHPENDQPQLVPDGAAAWDSGLLSAEGATFEHTFETAGVYHYYCTPHETGGMIGSVIVGEPDAHGQPALEELPEDKPESVRGKIEELNAMCNEALGHGH